MPKPYAVFIILIVLVGSINHYRHIKRYGKHAVDSWRGNNEQRIFMSRFAELRKTLPPDSVVGYIATPLSESAAPHKNSAWRQNRGWTRYALAPVIVEDSLAPNFIVGDFKNGRPSDKALREYGLTIIKGWPQRGLWLLGHLPEKP